MVKILQLKIGKIIREFFLFYLLLHSIPFPMILSTGQTASATDMVSLAATFPHLNFSTFLGGSMGNFGSGVAVSSDGSSYVVGNTWSSDFPTLNAFQSTIGGDCDVFIAKFSSNGSLLWSTFLGGSDWDYGYGIAVASDGSCFVIGQTGSSDFPERNAYSSFGVKIIIFVVKLSSSGSMLWSTFLGGFNNNFGHSIAVANDDSCYVTGYTSSSDFPILNAYDDTFNGGEYDIFIAKFSSNGSLLWSTFLGGSERDYGKTIALASDGSCYISGVTHSSDFPTLNAYDNTLSGKNDAFVTKFSSNGTLLWSTFLGGSELDLGTGIAVTSDGSCYVSGETGSSDFPTMNAYENTFSGEADAFVTKFSPIGTLLWSTYLGGKKYDRGSNIAVTSDGSCYVVGETFSKNFPREHAYDRTHNGEYDAFVTKFSPSGTLFWSTYLGGCDFDSGLDIVATNDGSCYVIGNTFSSDFPTLNAFQSTYGDSGATFLTKFIELANNHVSAIGFLFIFLVFPVLVAIIRKRRN